MLRDQELAGLAMTLGQDAKIRITVSGEGSFCTPDGSHINIARMPSTPVGRMLMTGLVFHEIGHKNYTKGGRPEGLLGDMMNVIEDIRVDRETIKARPGTCFNLEAITTHYAHKGSLEPADLAQALLGKVMAYGFGRVLKQRAILPLETLCDDMMDDAFGPDFVADVAFIIKDLPKLRSTSDATAMARKLIELLVQQQTPPAPVPKKPLPPPPGGATAQGQTQNGGQGNSSDTDRSQGPGGPGSQQQPSDQGLETAGAPDNQAPSPPDESPPQEQGPNIQEAAGAGGNGAGTGGGKRPTPEEIAEMLKTNTGYGDLSALIQSELDDLADSIPGPKVGIPMLPVIGKLRAVHGKLNEVEALSASSRMRAKLMGMLQSIKRQPESYGLSGRKLASGRLVKMAVGDPRIFRKKIDVVEVNTAVVVLLDLSGSMCSKYETANAAAFALHTTLYGLKGVAVCSVEFSGKNNEPEVNVLVDFGRKPKSENFNHRPFDGTPTHNAIWAGRVMLLQRPEPRKIMLILTDGCPSSGVETTAATQRTMRDGIEIAAIGIMDRNVRTYWDNHKIITNLQELPAAMFGIMEGLLVKR